MRFLRVLILIFSLCIVSELRAQKHTITINPDHTVKITLDAPNAKEVKISGTMFPLDQPIKTPAGTFGKVGKRSMHTDDSGMWSYTTTELKSDYYLYNFVVDGVVQQPSLKEKDAVRDIDNIYLWFIVPNGDGDDYKEKNVLHGNLTKVWYPSHLNGMSKRRMTIYTPPHYNEKDTVRYPVLYLLHGSGGDENSWTDCGRAAQILDNLVNDGRCEPMIVVMPNGNVDVAAAPGEDPSNPNVSPKSNNTTSMFGMFEKSFVPEIVCFVDNNYPTIPTKGCRAIAGLSLGGLHTLYTSLNNPDTFDYVGLFSAQTTNGLGETGIGDGIIDGLKKVGKHWRAFKDIMTISSDTKVDKFITSFTGGANEEIEVYENFDNKLQRQFETPPALFYIAVGRDDFTYKLNKNLIHKLDYFNCPYVYNESEGAHTWDNWRRYLLDFLPRLFNH